MKKTSWNVLVTGGAGYVGAALVPKLLAAGHRVTVLDLYLYGENVFSEYHENQNLREVQGDIRDQSVLRGALDGCDSVIHLACISNDPSFELNPALGKSINLDAFRPLVRASKAAGVERFVYASSSSVYGVREETAVTEDLDLAPLTDYSRFKADCESILNEEREPGFVTCILRPSTVCGYSPRQRLDVIVNLLTNHAVQNGKIRIFGGNQKRPNIHIEDMTDLYLFVLDQEDDKIDGEIFNAGYENHTLMDLADIVRTEVGGDIAIEVEPTDDLRSYHVSSEKMRSQLGFAPSHTIQDAVRDLINAFDSGKLPGSLDDSRYFNIKKMQEVDLA